MNKIFRSAAPLLFLGLVLSQADAKAQSAGEWSGYLSFDARIFADDPLFQQQEEQNFSVAFEPEYYVDWQEGDQRFVISPFFRYDSSDDERSHVDLRELYWRGSYANFDLKIGLSKVFWGVIESQHLVDIINQTDFVENIDTEDKLGQPMINLSLIQDWGTLDFFVLPYFRERTFAGPDGRLRGRFVIDTDNARYESGDEEKHVDLAIRWSHYFGDWDIGLAHFSGTAREPEFIVVAGFLPADAPLVLTPYYPQIEQTSLDLQATKGDWLWKLEAIYRTGGFEDYSAFAAGFEYTLVGIADGQTDLGLLAEYHYDEREERSSNPLQNDVFVAFRWVLNDVQSSELLAGVAMDVDSQSLFGSIEGSRRFGQSWKVTLEARFFADAEPSEPFYDLRQDDYLELQIAKYF